MIVPHHRHSIRLKGYDYSQPGAYFITLCVDQRQLVFEDETLKAIVIAVWQTLPAWFPTIHLDEFVVMPNHIHFIVWLCDRTTPATNQALTVTNVGATLAVSPGDAGTSDDAHPPNGALTAKTGAGASPAPTSPTKDVWPTAANVGATLAVAPGDAGTTDGAHPPNGTPAATTGAGVSPAPTSHDADNHIPASWTIPSPTHTIANPTLGEIVAAFKSLTFKVYLGWINTHAPNRRAQFWQRNYYEHVIRNETELSQIRSYILNNPINWELDPEYPAVKHIQS